MDAAAELAQPEIDYRKLQADYEDVRRQLDKFCRRPSAAPAAPAAGGGGDPRGPLQPRELDAWVGVLAGPDPGRPVPVDPGEQGHRDGRDADPGRGASQEAGTGKRDAQAVASRLKLRPMGRPQLRARVRRGC